MDPHEKKENEGHFDEPALEDFLPNEEDELLKEQQKKRNSFVKKVVIIVLAFSLVISMIQIWPQIFNISSIHFLQKSAELSKQDDIQKYKEAVVTIQDTYSKGTGFNISESGLIITNHHVVDDMYPITVVFPNGEIFNANIIHSESELDLAFLQIEGENLPSLSLSKPNLWQVNDQIYVIGNPLFHNQIANEGKILAGSEKNGVLKLSAPIYKGNSGSPVISVNGDVIGVVYAKSTTDQSGFAIPIEKILERLPYGY
ncbi:trypsin-like peptidase domain-containing protein [Bacillus sp. FJAT-49705]|uniref:Trypsin-like peptidase domain-containing protein n=1 Tax=Cytobacillus citreus TaxID=2833586 RepID=A0ABS5NYP5_9BACI|nr:serine protease [Cytobacillus citreus]MBS4192946.1 trypsin-like peptidase domain-containing protein [Cytobacillus citreus]